MRCAAAAAACARSREGYRGGRGRQCGLHLPASRGLIGCSSTLSDNREGPMANLIGIDASDHLTGVPSAFIYKSIHWYGRHWKSHNRHAVAKPRGCWQNC